MGFYFNYIVGKFILPQFSVDYSKINSVLNEEDKNAFMWSLNNWCFVYKVIMDKIDSEKLEELSEWEDDTDQAFIEEKSFFDEMMEIYKEENEYIERYIEVVPFNELVESYQKFNTRNYEPGEQIDVASIILDHFDKAIKNMYLHQDDNQAFYNVRELGKGSFGTVRLMTTNPVVFGIEVNVAVKAVSYSNDTAKLNKGQLESEKGEREFRLLRSIEHPNIMKAYFMWKTDEKKLKIASECLL